jgi:formylglycine-generating enzyme required for sulfatase activity
MMENRVPARLAGGMAALAVCVASPSFAQVVFYWAVVGNPGNAADPLNSGAIPGIGSMADVYRIARFEVTNDQYAKFLNAMAETDTHDLYNPGMGSDARGGITRSGLSGSFSYSVKPNMGNKPVNLVSYFDAMRFVNWLHNGQPSGAQDATTTEDGVYTISDGVSETRSPDARFFIPTENEWYKAAYHQPSADGGDSDDYWLYPTASNSIPTIASANAFGDISNPGPNVANYASGADWNGQNGNVTTVGSAGLWSESFYGTADQGGNVWEWNETVELGSSHVLRGGSWFFVENDLRSSRQDTSNPPSELVNIGFRVASPVPKPGVPIAAEWGLTAMALLVATAGTIVLGRRLPRPV